MKSGSLSQIQAEANTFVNDKNTSLLHQAMDKIVG